MELVKTSFDIPKELLQKFKETCAAQGVYMNFIVREQINKWLMAQENKLEGK